MVMKDYSRNEGEWEPNCFGGRENLDAMEKHGVTTLVFSSSATVYGADAPVPMREELPTSATNPYGWTKVMQEQIFRDAAVADPALRIALLRYFNPVGAHPSGTMGEDPAPEHSLTPPLGTSQRARPCPHRSEK